MQTVAEYLQHHGPALAGRIAERFRPLVTAPQLDVWRRLAKLKRAPFPAQASVIDGLVALFRSGHPPESPPRAPPELTQTGISRYHKMEPGGLLSRDRFPGVSAA